MKVAWFSAGVSSFIATYLTKDLDKIIYIDIDDQHPDSMRFVKDCEKALGREIEILHSPLGSVENAVLAFGGFRNANNGFYPCTGWLKKRVRKEWELKHLDCSIEYVWGMDADEKSRATQLTVDFPEFKHSFPLVSEGLKKTDCHAICGRMGVKRPLMYDMGYQNNNCICCVKGGMGYLNKCRVDFPEKFAERVKLERKVGSSILKECYLDELAPDRGNMQKEIMQDCSIFCELAMKPRIEG